MPVTQKPAPAIAAAVETPAPPAKVQLELALHQRYMLKQTLYEKGIVYAFTREQADDLLARQSDTGLPVFRLYVVKPKRTERNSEGRRTMDMTSADIPKPAGTVVISDNRMDIGDMDEVADLIEDSDEIEV